MYVVLFPQKFILMREIYLGRHHIIIGFLPCPTNVNPSGCPSGDLDTILFNGPYDPQFHGPGQQYQNFTVEIPPGTPMGVTQINIARFFLIGVSSNDLFNASPSLNILGCEFAYSWKRQCDGERGMKQGWE
jgi:hypothetical protein